MTTLFVDAGELMARRNGSVDPSKFPDEEFELHSIPAFDAGKPAILRGDQIGSTKQLVAPNDVMISKIVPHIRRSSIVPEFTGRRQIASSEWIVFRSTQFFPDYLRHFLASDDFHARFMKTVSGVGGSLLRARPAEVAKIKIPLPSLAEQRRLAGLLSRAEGIVRLRREAQRKAAELVPALFLHLFGDPAGNPKGWPVVELGEVADVQGGLQVTKARASHPIERIYLRVANVYRSHLDLRELKTIRLTEAELTRTRLNRGDLLFVEGHGNPEEVGRVAVWDGSIEDCTHQNHLIRARPEPNKLEPIFAGALLNSTSGRRELTGRAKTTSGLSTISANTVKSASIPLPPIELQRQFAAKADAVRGIIAQQHDALAKAQGTFEALLHGAFAQ